MGNLYRFVEPVALFLLKKNGPSHGYDLSSALNEHALTDAEIERAALYRTLRQLETVGHVTSTWDMSGKGPARHVYELTPSGEHHLDEWIVVLEALSGSMKRFVEDAKSVQE
jgi:DNA-binding PadR family transcriptional regulator